MLHSQSAVHPTAPVRMRHRTQTTHNTLSLPITHNGSNNKQRTNNNIITTLERSTAYSAVVKNTTITHPCMDAPPPTYAMCQRRETIKPIYNTYTMNGIEYERKVNLIKIQ